MKFSYDEQTDSLYIDFSPEKSVETIEISEGVLADYGQDGKLVGLDIDQASTLTNLQEMVWQGLSPESLVPPSTQ